MNTKKKFSQDRTGVVTELGEPNVASLRSMLRMEASGGTDGTKQDGLNLYKCGMGC